MYKVKVLQNAIHRFLEAADNKHVDETTLNELWNNVSEMCDLVGASPDTALAVEKSIRRHTCKRYKLTVRDFYYQGWRNVEKGVDEAAYRRTVGLIEKKLIGCQYRMTCEFPMYMCRGMNLENF